MKMKKKNIKKKNNKGFTLIELLATIAILSIVVSISLYISMDVLSKAKGKSYQVTINNVEKNANNYVAENNNKIFYLTSSDGKSEYQCVTISNLIETGYLDTNVINSPINTDGDKVAADDYIYIERDAKSKALLKSIYDVEGDYDCSNTIKASGDITFVVNPSMNTWSKEKKVIINYKVKNRQNASNYQYIYALNSSTDEIVADNNPMTITINEPTTIHAKILNGSNSIVYKTLDIGSIDNVGPIISLTNDTLSSAYNGTAKIPISVTDTGSGVDSGSIDKTDFKVTIGGASISLASIKLTKLSETTSLVKYELEITDSTHRGELAVKIAENSFFDKVENGNEAVELQLNTVMNQIYKVTADGRGGTIAVTTGWTGSGSSANKNVTYGETYGGLPSATLTGYTLDGWYTTASSGDKITTTTTVTKGSNHTIYAHWNANKYTITLNKNGGTNTPTASVQVTYGTKTLAPSSITLPEKKYTVSGFALADTRNSTGASISSTSSLVANNAFNGWYSASSGGIKIMSNATSPVLQSNATGYTGASGIWIKDGNATLYAQYTNTSVKLPTITKEGYTCGWTTSSAGKTIEYAGGANFTPTANTTIYGVCVGKPYTITLNKNGGNNTPTASIQVTYGTKTLTPSSITLPEKKYTVSGFTLADARNSTGATVSSTASLTVTNAFNGWWSASSGGSKVMSNAAKPVLQANITGYTGASGVWTKVGNATVYAQYNSGSVKLPTITKAGYDCGWTTSSAGKTIVYASGGSIAPTGNTTLYGVCVGKLYTITLNKNGGTNTPTASVQVTYGTKTLTPSSITLPEKKYTVSGFALADARNSTGATVSSTASLTVTNAFNGWWSASSGGIKIMSNAASPVLQSNASGYTGASGIWTKVGNATLYAQYNSGSVKLPTITKAGYDCGWTTSSAGKTIVYASGGSIVPTGNTTLYGVCVGKPYTITLNKNGGTNTPTASVQVTYGTKTLTPSSITLPEKKYTVSGFELADARNSTGASVSSTASLTVTNAFNGWWSASSGGSKVMSNAAKPVLQADISGYTGASGFWTKVGNATLYAQYNSGSVKLPTITKSGYICGWTTSSAGKTIVYASGASITATKNTTLYGVCTGASYTITLNKNGGTNTPTASVQVTYGTKTLAPSSITLPEKKYTVSGFALADARNSTGATVSSTASLTVTNAFNGWWSASSGGIKIMSNAASPVLQSNASGYTGASGIWTKVGNATVYAQYNSGSVKLPTITKAGYDCGWTTSSAGKTIVYASGGSIAPTGNTTIYGVCVGKTYTITLNKNGGTNTPTASVQVTYGTKTLTPSSITLPEKKYTISGFALADARNSTGASVSNTASLTATNAFNGWWSASSGGSKVMSNAAKPVLQADISGYTGASGVWTKVGNATLYAQYNSGSVKLPTITKSGYDCGWTTSSAGKTIVYASGGSIAPTGNTTLYGVCVGKAYTITLNKNGGTNTPTASVQVTYGTKTLTPSTITLPEKKYTVSGFALAANRNSTSASVSSTASLTATNAFNGWWSAASGGIKIMSNAASPVLQTNASGYTGASGIWTKVGNATVYAQYNSGSVKLPTITKSGYDCGWTASSTGATIQYASGANFAPTSNTTLYGVCVGKTYTVTLNKNGSHNTPTASVQVTYGAKTINPSTITIGVKYYKIYFSGGNSYRDSTGASISSTSTKTIYETFNGWYTAANGGSMVLTGTNTPTLKANVTNYTGASGIWAKASNTTLYAQFTPESFKLPTITKTGYTCGWTNDNYGTSIKYTSGAYYTPTQDITLYAVCEAEEIYVSFDDNGLGGLSPRYKYVYYGNTYGTLPSVNDSSSCGKYSFDGWYTRSSGGTRVYNTTTVTSAYDHTLYAHKSYNGDCCTNHYYCDYGGSYNSRTGMCTASSYTFSGSGTLKCSGGKWVSGTETNQSCSSGFTKSASCQQGWTGGEMGGACTSSDPTPIKYCTAKCTWNGDYKPRVVCK